MRMPRIIVQGSVMHVRVRFVFVFVPFANPNDVRAQRCDFLIGGPARKIEWRKH